MPSIKTLNVRQMQHLTETSLNSSEQDLLAEDNPKEEVEPKRRPLHHISTTVKFNTVLVYEDIKCVLKVFPTSIKLFSSRHQETVLQFTFLIAWKLSTTKNAGDCL